MVDNPFEIQSFLTSGEYKLHYRHYHSAGIPKATIVFIHGIQSHGGWYETSCKKFAQAGYRVLFLDRRGSGLVPELTAELFRRAESSYQLRFMPLQRALRQVQAQPNSCALLVERRADVTYDDLGGMASTIDALRVMVDLTLSHPEVFQRLGVDPQPYAHRKRQIRDEHVRFLHQLFQNGPHFQETLR